MKKNTIVMIIMVLIMLTGGWLLFRTLNSPASAAAVADDGFRAWFWEKRGLDLIVQVILVFAGALGIAAILPVEDEDD